MPGHGLQARGIAREQKMIYAGMTLFLEQGYGRTTTAQIARKAGMSPASFFAAFENKEALLLRLTQIMFRSQFSRAEKMLPADQSPLLLYAMETGLQLHVAECSEPLRDLYVTAYSLPSTSDFINRSMTPRLRQIFSRWMKRADDSELFELELASAGVTRSYMSVPCDMYFTMERKIRRYLSCCFRIYCVPEKNTPLMWSASCRRICIRWRRTSSQKRSRMPQRPSLRPWELPRTRTESKKSCRSG